MLEKISNFLSPTINILGLDVGFSSIKMVELQGDDLNSLELKSYATVSIPQDILAENGEFKEENAEKLSELILKCWKKTGSVSKNVAISINSNNVIIKNITIPKFNSDEELQLAIENEFLKLLPEEIDINDLAIDYFVLKDNEFNIDEMDMLVVGSKKEKIDFLKSVIEDAGLTIEIADIENFAIENSLKLMKGDAFSNGNYVFADCSGAMIRMYAYSNGMLVATKESTIGGMALTQDLANNLGISFDEAEKIKTHGYTGENLEIAQAIESNFIQNYKSEFMSLLYYFSSAHSISKFDDIVLTGGVTKIKNFEQILIDGLSENKDFIVLNEPYIGRLLENSKKSSSIDLEKFQQDEPILFLAIYLALRQFLRKF